jgi:hypothetical protein
MITINPDADIKTADRTLTNRMAPGAIPEDFRIEYHGSKTISKNGSSCTITVFNLGQEAREFISGLALDLPRVILETGYDGNLEILFSGSINMIRHRHNYPNWETEIVCDGGMGAAKKLRLKAGYDAAPTGKATSDVISTVVNEALKLLKDNGLNISGTAKIIIDRAIAKFKAGAKGYAKGLSFDGSALDLLDNIIGKEYGAINVDNGELDIFDYSPEAMTKYVPIQMAYLLNPETGLISSPEPTDNGGVSFDCLLLPSLKPGSVVDVNGETYVLSSINYSGNNKDGSNTASCEAKAIKNYINVLKAYKISGIYY